MLPEIEFNNRVKGISPSHEQLQHYATIFRVSDQLSFSMAYIDGYQKASYTYIKIIEQLVAKNKNDNNIKR